MISAHARSAANTQPEVWACTWLPDTLACSQELAASLRSADSSSCAGLPGESWEQQKQASEILWCLQLRPLVKRPWTLQASQDLLNSPYFLDVPPMPWLSQAALIFLAAPCQASLSCLTCAVDAPVVPSGSRGPRPLLFYGLFQDSNRKHWGQLGHSQPLLC